VGLTNASLSLIDQHANLFHIATSAFMPTDANYATTMKLAGPGNSKIPSVADPAVAGWDQLGSHLCRCHPLLHKYIICALTLLVQGSLANHKAMWEGLAPGILSDATKAAAHHSLLNFLKLTMMRRAHQHGDAANDGTQGPQGHVLHN
jgi:hypothetical protein